jgi:soluble lytic murein transglycosylase-like protein
MNFSRPAKMMLASAAAIVTCAMPAAAEPAPHLSARIIHHAQANGVPVPLAKAVIRIESNFRPAAANRGNFGLMQIRLGTARSLGYAGGAAGLLDPETNLTYGMKYLGHAHRLAGGDTCGAIMRYQGGLRTTRMSGASRAYCGRARQLMARAD